MNQSEGVSMWDRPVMRWVGIPAIFLAVGPPAGATALFVLSTVLIGPFAPLAGLPILLVFSYLLGGAQALLAGFVAAATVRRGGGIRALPPVLASAVVGVLFASLAAVAADDAADSEDHGAAVLVNAVTLVLVHLAGGLAGVAACRWVERRRARRATPA